MKQRGRTSAAALSVAALPSNSAARPGPPPDLSERSTALWRATVSALPVDWFSPEQLPQLRAYVGHMERAERFERMLDEHDGDDLAEMDRISRMIERENRAALALARSLRLTKQSQVDPKAAGRKGPGRPHIDFSNLRDKS